MAFDWFGNTGLVTLLSKIKSLADTKVDKVDGKGLSSNDYTTGEKIKLAGIENSANNYILPTASADVLGGVKVGDRLKINNGVLSADAYVLPEATTEVLGGVKVGEGLKVNAGVVSVDPNVGKVKSVNGLSGDVVITAGDLDAYTKAEVDGKITGVYKPMGSKPTYADLPTQGNKVGDVWNVIDTGKNYAWTEEGIWDDLGGIVDTSNLVARTEMVEITAADVAAAWETVFK